MPCIAKGLEVVCLTCMNKLINLLQVMNITTFKIKINFDNRWIKPMYLSIKEAISDIR